MSSYVELQDYDSRTILLVKKALRRPNSLLAGIQNVSQQDR